MFVMHAWPLRLAQSWALLSLLACASWAPAQPKPAAWQPPSQMAAAAGRTAEANPPGPDQASPLARLQLDSNASQYEVLRHSDLSAATRQRLQNLDDTYAQRRYALLWSGLEETLAQRLLLAEAQRRQGSLAVLLDTEVNSKIGQPSDRELHDLYASHKELIGSPFNAARPRLQQLWQADRARALRRALIDRLRQTHQATLQVQLPLPQLSRRQVDVAQAPSRGPQQAPLTLVAFGDYQCPYSAQARRLLQRLAELYPKQLRLVYRDFVLPQHARSMAAAQAAHCAQAQHKFWDYYDLLFAHSEALESADLRHYASQLQLNMPAFQACLQDKHSAAAVLQSTAAGQAAGVQGTPALFINGLHIQGVLPLPLMQQLIEAELAQTLPVDAPRA